MVMWLKKISEWIRKKTVVEGQWRNTKIIKLKWSFMEMKMFTKGQSIFPQITYYLQRENSNFWHWRKLVGTTLNKYSVLTPSTLVYKSAPWTSRSDNWEAPRSLWWCSCHGSRWSEFNYEETSNKSKHRWAGTPPKVSDHSRWKETRETWRWNVRMTLNPRLGKQTNNNKNNPQRTLLGQLLKFKYWLCMR